MTLPSVIFPVQLLQGVQKEVCQSHPPGDPPEKVPRGRQYGAAVQELQEDVRLEEDAQ